MTFPRRLTLILGDGLGGGADSRSSLLLMPAPKETQREPIQLTIPVLTYRPETLVSFGSEALSRSVLVQLLSMARVRRVVDVRASPSFGSRCTAREFFTALSEHGVSYQHAPELANPFVADSWSDEAWLESYAEYLRGRARPHLTRLRDELSGGPLLLLGRSPGHDGSERQVIVDELAALNGEFDLTIPAPLGSAAGQVVVKRTQA